MNERPMVKGLPVPWITRWSSEALTPGPRVGLHSTRSGSEQVFFEDEGPGDRHEGVLWLRENDTPGVGDPIWKEVHSGRQRQAQTEGRCQVCGRASASPWLWLVPQFLGFRHEQGGITTDVAPTCAQCLDLAMTRCPTLGRSPVTLYEVFDYRPWSLFGDLVVRGPRGLVHTQADVRLGSGDINNVVARQMVVHLYNVRRRRM